MAAVLMPYDGDRVAAALPPALKAEKLPVSSTIFDRIHHASRPAALSPSEVAHDPVEEGAPTQPKTTPSDERETAAFEFEFKCSTRSLSVQLCFDRRGEIARCLRDCTHTVARHAKVSFRRVIFPALCLIKEKLIAFARYADKRLQAESGVYAMFKEPPVRKPKVTVERSTPTEYLATATVEQLKKPSSSETPLNSRPLH